jgi:drug/metabolite transporter superfamily protein YnfA
MFIGHFGVALAAKRLAPKTSLATLIASAQFLDLLWPVLLLLGLEHVRVVPGITKVQALDFYDYPFSHSLTMALRWALAVGLIYYLLRRSFRAAGVVGGLVLSHWVLDFVVHRPDLPLWPGGPKYGLGLWNSWAATISVEVLLFAAGIWLYVSATRGTDAAGKWGFWGLMALLLFGWLAATFGPPPPDVHKLALGGMAMWIVLPWAWWVDQHRELT